MKPKSMAQSGSSQQGSWSWLDRVQTKLESLYETEQGGSVFLQETGRMLESQVSKVGANVKKLYSDFVRELLLPLDVPGESQAWVEAQACLKAPAIAGSDEIVPGEEQPGARDEEGDEHGRKSRGQSEDDEKAASVLSASDLQEFEVLAPPLFQAPPLEETHEDLRVKEGVTKLHLKLQEMQRIESDKAPAVQRDTHSLPVKASAVEAAPAESEPESGTEPEFGAETKVEMDEKSSAEISAQSLVQSAQPVDKTRVELPGGLAADSVPLDAAAESVSLELAAQSVSVDVAANLASLDVAAESDTAELSEFASETDGEAGRRDEDDLLSGNESDQSQRAKWYRGKGPLPRGGSIGEESGKGGWFDWELV